MGINIFNVGDIQAEVKDQIIKGAVALDTNEASYAGTKICQR